MRTEREIRLAERAGLCATKREFKILGLVQSAAAKWAI